MFLAGLSVITIVLMVLKGFCVKGMHYSGLYWLKEHQIYNVISY